MQKLIYKTRRCIFLWVDYFLGKLGFQLVHKQALPTMPGDIDLVIDVGVAYGTPWLLDQYPKSKFIFIEPNPQYLKIVKQLCEKYDGLLITDACGAKISKQILTLDDTASRLTERTDKDSSLFEKTEITVRPLDNILESCNLPEKPKSIFLKIDTEGYELEVLKGATRLLKSGLVGCIFLELRIANIDTYSPSELITFLNDYHYEWHVLADVAYKHKRVSYLDVMFTLKKT